MPGKNTMLSSGKNLSDMAATPFQPVLSVITVVYNNVRDIERTLLSVLNQVYPHIEYIVIDGGSNDGTKEVIQKYQERIAHFVSEPDRGIYDAMNKGLAVATGEYVLFMNSGDELYDASTVEAVFAVVVTPAYTQGQRDCL